MKVTKEEVQEVIDEVEADHRKEIDVEIKLGIEDDGDMAIILLTKERSTKIIMDMHRMVRKLGRKHKEVYYVEVLWNSTGWFRHYQRQSGFEELKEEDKDPIRCPLDAKMYANGDVLFIWKGSQLGRVHIENLDVLLSRLVLWQDGKRNNS